MPGGAIPGPIGTVLRTPGRAVTAIHTFYKMATYEMGIQRLAYRAAMMPVFGAFSVEQDGGGGGDEGESVY
jgi:hypothetical protein